jgi:hypothetical protein
LELNQGSILKSLCLPREASRLVSALASQEYPQTRLAFMTIQMTQLRIHTLLCKYMQKGRILQEFYTTKLSNCPPRDSPKDTVIPTFPATTRSQSN